MSRPRHKTGRFFRTTAILALAVWSGLATLGNPTGLVLCIEDDGSMAIETPAEQAACHHRHELAAAAPATESPAFQAVEATCCIDIPLSIASAATVYRSVSARVVVIERLDSAYSPSDFAQLRLLGGDSVSHQAFGERPPAATAVALLRTVILLI